MEFLAIILSIVASVFTIVANAPIIFTTVSAGFVATSTIIQAIFDWLGRTQSSIWDNLRHAVFVSPFALLGALVALSLISGFFGLHPVLVSIVEWVRALFHPIWDYLFRWLPFDLSDFAKDYLTMSSVFLGMEIRYLAETWRQLSNGDWGRVFFRILHFIKVDALAVRQGQNLKFWLLQAPLQMVVNSMLWPMLFAIRLYVYFTGTYKRELQVQAETKNLSRPLEYYIRNYARSFRVYFETLVWIAVLLIASALAQGQMG